MTREEFLQELHRLMRSRYSDVESDTPITFMLEMVSDEAIAAVHSIARWFEGQGQTEQASLYEDTAQWLASLRDSLGESGSGEFSDNEFGDGDDPGPDEQAISIDATVPWAILARKDLCIREYPYIDDAIASAEAVGAADAADCLRGFLRRDLNGNALVTKAHALAMDYARQGRREESLTVELMALSVFATLSDGYDKHPVHEWAQLRAIAIGSARQAITLASYVHADACAWRIAKFERDTSASRFC